VLLTLKNEKEYMHLFDVPFGVSDHLRMKINDLLVNCRGKKLAKEQQTAAPAARGPLLLHAKQKAQRQPLLLPLVCQPAPSAVLEQYISIRNTNATADLQSALVINIDRQAGGRDVLELIPEDSQ
jgi:hypothetical protein